MPLRHLHRTRLFLVACFGLAFVIGARVHFRLALSQFQQHALNLQLNAASSPDKERNLVAQVEQEIATDALEAETPACSKQCQDMFLVNGIQPMFKRDNNTDENIPKEWITCDCDTLFCAGKLQSSCQWSRFAIDTLLHSLDDTACDAVHANEFRPAPYWERYRVSDEFNGYRCGNEVEGWESLTRPQKLEAWTAMANNFTFPGTLADAYYKESVKQGVMGGKYELLYRIVKDRIANTPPEKLPPPNTLVIHLRLGDVVDYAFHSVLELLAEQQYFFWKPINHIMDGANSGIIRPGVHPIDTDKHIPHAVNWNRYVKPLSYYHIRVLEHDTKENLYSSVVLMASAHAGRFGELVRTTKSCLYAKTLQAFLKRELPNADITLRLGNPPDDDVVFATQAAGYWSAGGGFSELIGRLNAMNAKRNGRSTT